MDFELRAAKEKLEREQKERKEKARLKLEREKRARNEAMRQREAIEAVQRIRRLDAAEAELKANQQREESLLSGNGVMFYRILEAVPVDGFGDKIRLPPSCFTELSNQGALDKGPMYFRLTKIYQENTLSESEATKSVTTHSGVLEFTADEGCVLLPPHVWGNLYHEGSQGTPLIEVRYVRLPKGRYVKLKPDRLSFSDISNHKAVLETSLRHHATLSQGDTITVSHGDVSYKMQVLELMPSSAVSVLETDIEVDIVNPDLPVDCKDQQVLIPLMLGKQESGTVEEGTYRYYKFTINDDTSLGDKNIEIKLDSETNMGDTDIYVSRHPIIFPSQNQHEWSSHDIGSKTLIIKPASKIGGTYSISVYGFKGLTTYRLLVSTKDGGNWNMNMRAQDLGTSSLSDSDVDTLECRNCKRNIPSRTIALHEAFCTRHNVVCLHNHCGLVLRKEDAADHVHCPKCEQPFQRSALDKHMKIFHEPLHCPCGVTLEKEEMVQHRASICPLRLIACQFCGDMVQAGYPSSNARDRLRGLSEHESKCGSRTAPCDSCGRSIMLKDMEIHRIAVHQKN